MNDAGVGHITVFDRGIAVYFAFDAHGTFTGLSSFSWMPECVPADGSAATPAPTTYRLSNIDAVHRVCGSFVPAVSLERRRSLRLGDVVELRAEFGDGAAETFWVRISDRDDDGGYAGKVELPPRDACDELRAGDEVGFGAMHVVAIQERA